MINISSNSSTESFWKATKFGWTEWRRETAWKMMKTFMHHNSSAVWWILQCSGSDISSVIYWFDSILFDISYCIQCTCTARSAGLICRKIQGVAMLMPLLCCCNKLNECPRHVNNKINTKHDGNIDWNSVLCVSISLGKSTFTHRVNLAWISVGSGARRSSERATCNLHHWELLLIVFLFKSREETKCNE